MTAAARQDAGNFGLLTSRLVIDPGTPIGELLSDALLLLGSGLAVIDNIDAESMPAELFGALYLLRQAHFTLDNAQLAAMQGQAAGGVE